MAGTNVLQTFDPREGMNIKVPSLTDTVQGAAFLSATQTAMVYAVYVDNSGYTGDIYVKVWNTSATSITLGTTTTALAYVLKVKGGTIRTFHLSAGVGVLFTKGVTLAQTSIASDTGTTSLNTTPKAMVFLSAPA